ncbi:hypothetical protein [Plantactinospora sp. DSM 117369]
MPSYAAAHAEPLDTDPSAQQDPSASEVPAGRHEDPEADLDDLSAKLRAENGALLGGMSDEELRRGVRVGKKNIEIKRQHRLGVFERDLLLFVAEDARARNSGGHLWEPYARQDHRGRSALYPYQQGAPTCWAGSGRPSPPGCKLDDPRSNR